MRVKQKKNPFADSKPDTSAASDGLAEAIRRHKERTAGRRLVPLRVDSRTVIYTPPGRATDEYARLWRERRDASARKWGS